jgi:hypothetical protein
LVISQVLRFFRLKPGFSLAKPRFLAEVVQKLKFPNNSIIGNNAGKTDGDVWINGKRS